MQIGSRSVIVFGATSYLGQFIIETLLRDGYKVLAVSRDHVKCSILLADYLRDIEVVLLEKIADASHKYNKPAAVINLAYIKDSPVYAIHRRNKRLIEQIDYVAKATSCERLIHVSTQAVFGYSFDHSPLPTDARFKRSDPYIETKIHAERLLRKLNRENRYSLSIVRLGNLIGAGSPVWIANLAQRILEGRPVGYLNSLGYSNSTYSRNTADYICFLIKQPRNLLDNFGIYHHLAEFFDYPWTKMLEYLSGIIGKRFNLVSFSDVSEFHNGGGLSYNIISRLKKGVLGSYLRMAANSFISERFFADVVSLRLKQMYIAQPHVGPIEEVGNGGEADKTLFEIMAEEKQFKPHLVPEWSTPFTVDDALVEIEDWLKRAGYVIEKDPKLFARG